MKKYKITMNQYYELEGLFANTWILKHEDTSEEIRAILEHNLSLIFNELNRLNCPLEVQSIVISLAEVKANQGYYLMRLLAREGVAWL